MKLSRFYLRFFTRHSTRRQLVTLFICAVLIPFALIGGGLCLLFYHEMEGSYEQLTRSKALQVRTTSITTSIYMYSVYESVAENDDLQTLLCSEERTPQIDQLLYEQNIFFERLLQNTASLSQLTLYVPQELFRNLPSSSYLSPVTEEIAETDWYEKASSQASGFYASLPRLGQQQIPYWELHYICRIPIPRRQTFGVLVMSLSNNYLSSLISGDGYEISISVNDEPVFYSTDRMGAGAPFPTELSPDQENGACQVMDVNGSPRLACLQTVTPYLTHDQFHILTSDPSALGELHRMAVMLGVIMVLSLGIPAIIIWLYSGYFSARINTLRLAMYKVSNNDYEIVNSIQGDDELTAAFHDLKVMVENLKSAQAQIYQARLQEEMLLNQQQQMEMKLLASQINPHFLYNTLETIRMKAFSQGNRDVANAIKLLGKSMRYVLSNTKTAATTLDKELDYIDTYLAIQKIRFGSRIDYSIRVSPKLEPEHYRILPLLIQPVVENAISHGIEDTGEDGNLILHLDPSPDMVRLIIKVFDNGCGMRPEQETKVNEMAPPARDSSHGVGLYNIHSRIHLFYGSEYGIHLKSRLNVGTLVTIIIPLENIREEE